MFQEPWFQVTFRVLPVQFRALGAADDPDHPTRPRLVFIGDVRDGQTMYGRVGMTPDGHLRWKWVRLLLIFPAMQFTLIRIRNPLQVCGEGKIKLSGGIYPS